MFSVIYAESKRVSQLSPRDVEMKDLSKKGKNNREDGFDPKKKVAGIAKKELAPKVKDVRN